MKEKKPEMKKTIEMIKQNTYEKKNVKNTIPEALISRPRKKFNNNRPCRFCNAPSWNSTHKCPALDQTCNNCGKKGHFARTCRQRENYKNKLRNVTETENLIGEKSDESESSIYRIERVNRIIDRNKYLTITVKINGTEKEFIIDTGSPISKMPADNKILTEFEIQKVRHRYQDVNKKVKFRGKIPVDIEYDNNKQKI